MHLSSAFTRVQRCTNFLLHLKFLKNNDSNNNSNNNMATEILVVKSLVVTIYDLGRLPVATRRFAEE